MRKRLMICFATACLFVGGAFAAGGDASEGGVPTSPLKIYSGGFGGGFFYGLSDEFKEECGDVFLKVVWLNSFDFTDNVAFFADINWYAGSELANFGFDLGADYLFSTGRLRPLLGLGVGGHYFHRAGAKDDFGKSFGASATAHVGVAIELTESVQIKIRAPIHVMKTKNTDLGAGVDFGLMFVNKLRKVRKLDY